MKVGENEKQVRNVRVSGDRNRQVETNAGGQTGVSSTSPRQIPGCFFANAGVGSGDDDRFAIQPLLRCPAVEAHAPERVKKKESSQRWGKKHEIHSSITSEGKSRGLKSLLL